MINKLSKIILGLGLFSILGFNFYGLNLSFVEIASAGIEVTQDTRNAGVIPDVELNNEETSFIETVQIFINWILGFLGIIVFGLFLIAGFQYATAGGDEGTTKKALSTMTNGVIGLIILFFAFSATNLIVGFALNV